MMTNPNMVPYQKEWDDNIGGMANAIFWLKDNWKSMTIAQGTRINVKDECELWTYEPIREKLVVYSPANEQRIVVTDEKMFIGKDARTDLATIYRPFFAARHYGAALYDENRRPVIEWLVTREVIIRSEHHADRIPLYLGTAVDRLRSLMPNKPFGQFSDIILGEYPLTLPRVRSREYLTTDQAVAFHTLLRTAKTLSERKDVFQDFHIHSYKAFFSELIKFDNLINSANEKDITEILNMTLCAEMRRLFGEGRLISAALIDALVHDTSYKVAANRLEALKAVHPSNLNFDLTQGPQCVV